MKKNLSRNGAAATRPAAESILTPLTSASGATNSTGNLDSRPAEAETTLQPTQDTPAALPTITGIVPDEIEMSQSEYCLILTERRRRAMEQELITVRQALAAVEEVAMEAYCHAEALRLIVGGNSEDLPAGMYDALSGVIFGLKGMVDKYQSPEALNLFPEVKERFK